MWGNNAIEYFDTWGACALIWCKISTNPSIFQWDYTFYRKRMDIHREELMKAVFHPKRLKRSLELGYNLFDELE